MERKIQELCEEAKKQKQWYEEQWGRERELTNQTEKTLNTEMAHRNEALSEHKNTIRGKGRGAHREYPTSQKGAGGAEGEN